MNIDVRRLRSGYGMVAAAAALWGTWSLFLRRAERISALAPVLEGFVIFATMAVVGIPLAWRAAPRGRRSRRSWALLAALGAADAGNVVCFFWAMQKGSVAVAVLFHYLAPLLIAVAAPYFLRERTRFPALALTLALSGLVVLVGSRPISGDVFAAALLGTASAIFYALTTLLNKYLEVDFSATELLAHHALAAAVLLSPALFVNLGGSVNAVAYLVAGAIVLAVGATLLYLNGLRRVPASRAAVLTLIEPVVALFIAAVVWGEPLTIRAGLGAALVLAGAYLVLRARYDVPR
jgi:drug/metabolite transporter (DMT)-like permease